MILHVTLPLSATTHAANCSNEFVLVLICYAWTLRIILKLKVTWFCTRPCLSQLL